MSNKDSVRILHVVGGMNRAGYETWLMHVLRHIDREQFRMDFVVHTTEQCAYGEEIRALGSKVLSCLHPHRPMTYARNFKQILLEHGPYDVVHGHVHHYSGYVLRLAHEAGVPVRIAHSHNDTSQLEAEARLLRRLYFALMKQWIHRYATVGLAASGQAATALFGTDWETDHRWRTLYYSVDFAPFRTSVDPSYVRAELGVSPHDIVMGHVGRFVEQKNHRFLIEIAAEVVKREPRARLLLVGDGPLRPVIERQVVAQIVLANRVIFAGTRPDISRIMLGAMDVLLFPSLFEGLGLVLVEAQAAGLPCIYSDVVPKEADVVRPLVRRLSLSQPASAWTDAVLPLLDGSPPISQAQALALLEQSPFNIRTAVKKLEEMYRVFSTAGRTSGGNGSPGVP